MNTFMNFVYTFGNKICGGIFFMDINRINSILNNDEKFDEYVKELNELFDKYEKNGIATVPNYTEVYIGEV